MTDNAVHITLKSWAEKDRSHAVIALPDILRHGTHNDICTDESGVHIPHMA